MKTTMFEVYCTAGFYPMDHNFMTKKAAVEKAKEESAKETKPEWKNYVVTKVVTHRTKVFEVKRCKMKLV